MFAVVPGKVLFDTKRRSDDRDRVFENRCRQSSGETDYDEQPRFENTAEEVPLRTHTRKRLTL